MKSVALSDPEFVGGGMRRQPVQKGGLGTALGNRVVASRSAAWRSLAG